MTSCTAPVRDMTCGALMCPAVPWAEPEDGQTWEEYCRECVEGQERLLELLGDCARDEA
jgi:hypothetical protein